jgi:hypothetical protein
MVPLVLILTALSGAPPAPVDFHLAITVTQGGINPGEHRFELEGDGKALERTWRLASKQPTEQHWVLTGAQVEAIRARLRQASPALLEGPVNQAAGVQQQFATRLEVEDNGLKHDVTAYTFGSPAPPEELTKLISDLRTMLLSSRGPASQ